MTNDQKFLVWGEGVMFVDGEECPEVQEIGFNFGIENIQVRKGDGGGNIVEPTGQPITGRAVLAGMNPALFAELTGGSNATGTYKRVRSEELTKSTNTLTLSQTPVTNTLHIVPKGNNKAPLVQVASAPSVGEYSVSGTTVTLNASQTESDFYCSYIYESASDGLTTSLDPTDLPSEFEVYATIRAKDLYPGTKGDVIVYAAKCTRMSELSMGGAVGDAGKPGFDFNVRIDSASDFGVYWPAT